MKTFGEIPLTFKEGVSLKVFLSVMVSYSRRSLMEDGHVDMG